MPTMACVKKIVKFGKSRKSKCEKSFLVTFKRQNQSELQRFEIPFKKFVFPIQYSFSHRVSVNVYTKNKLQILKFKIQLNLLLGMLSHWALSHEEYFDQIILQRGHFEDFFCLCLI